MALLQSPPLTHKGRDYFSAFGFPILEMGGLPISSMTRAEAAAFLNQVGLRPRPWNKPPLYVTSANGEVLSRVAADPKLRRSVLAADMIHADGQAMVLASRLPGRVALPERVATTDLFHDVARLAERSGASFYLLGGQPDVLDATLAAVRTAYPKLKIVGARHGYFDLEDEAGVVAAINEARPSILWVAMGVPREQAFAERNRKALNEVGVIKTAGGLFDFLSGRRSRAPRWMQNAGLEWLYRTWLEPRRLAKRYLTTNPHALLIMLRRSGR